jgi:hypothetical protein
VIADVVAATEEEFAASAIPVVSAAELAATEDVLDASLMLVVSADDDAATADALAASAAEEAVAVEEDFSSTQLSRTS